MKNDKKGAKKREKSRDKNLKDEIKWIKKHKMEIKKGVSEKK